VPQLLHALFIFLTGLKAPEVRFIHRPGQFPTRGGFHHIWNGHFSS